MRKLIIVESPTKARTLARFLGDGYWIEATMGHMRDLPKKRLGIKIKSKIKNQKLKMINNKNQIYEFQPEYVVEDKRKKEIVKKLRKIAEGAEKIILATDPDREGEAIAQHAVCVLGSKSKIPACDGAGKNQKSKISRIVFHEITKTAVEHALMNAGKINMNLVDAQQARRVLDRLVGYKVSPVLWYKVRRGLSAGRVQSVAVRLIVEREREIEAFKPEEYWKIEAELQKILNPKFQIPNNIKIQNSNDQNRSSFLAKLVKIGEKKTEIKNKDQADEIVTELRKCEYRVTNIDKREAKRYPSPPFTTSTLQQTASRYFGWSGKKTMSIGQRLYEKGLITYHRTDSMSLAGEAVKMCRDYIYNVYGKDYLPEKLVFYKTKSKVAQEAHEAIRPTKIRSVSPAFLPDNQTKGGSEYLIASHERLAYADADLSRNESKLYDLIFKRFVACQMKPQVVEETKAFIEAKSVFKRQAAAGQLIPVYLLEAKGEREVFGGWKVAYASNPKSQIPNSKQIPNPKSQIPNKETIRQKDGDNEKILPPLIVNEFLKLIRLIPEQKFTQPPPRYSEAMLIKSLEEKGIGRPSTYAPIVSTIQDRQYVEKVEKRFKPTVLGITVNDFLTANFGDIVDYDFTAKMEDDLDSIARGERKWMLALSEFYGPFEKNLENVKEKAKRVAVPVEKTNEKCEKCGAGMIIRIGRFGRFLACSKFPDCKFTKPLVEKLENVKCPECGGEVVVKKTKKGSKFYGCGSYPKCRWASWRKP